MKIENIILICAIIMVFVVIAGPVLPYYMEAHPQQYAKAKLMSQDAAVKRLLEVRMKDGWLSQSEYKEIESLYGQLNSITSKEL